jgi:hypothetical protein
MPADETPTELFTPEQVQAAYREALAGVPDDLPTEAEVLHAARAVGFDGHPF